MPKITLKSHGEIIPFQPSEIVYPSERDQTLTGFIPAIVNDILTNLQAGMELTDCANLLKMPIAHLRGWYNNNYCNFRYAADYNKSKNKKHHMIKVQRLDKKEGVKADPEDFKTSSWFLERKYKDEFSKEVTVNVNHRVIISVIKINAAILIKYIPDPDKLRLAKEELVTELNRISLEQSLVI